MWPAKYLHKPNADWFSHLEELRQRLLISLLVFIAASIISYFFSSHLIEWLTWPLRRYNDTQLIFQKPYEAFLVHIQVAALAGVIFSSPILLTQLWCFISPGLYEREKKLFLSLIGITIALFLIGILFAFYVIIPWGLHFLLSYQTETVQPLLDIGAYFSFVIGMILAFGVLFDFPIIIFGLVKLGITNARDLAGARKIIIVLIFIAAALLTPSPDPLSQLALAIPLILLFELTLLVCRWSERRPAV